MQLLYNARKALKNIYEDVHFSKVAGLLPTTLLKMNSFTGSFQLFSNTYTNIYFAEQVSLATPEIIRKQCEIGGSGTVVACDFLIYKKGYPQSPKIFTHAYKHPYDTHSY